VDIVSPLPRLRNFCYISANADKKGVKAVGDSKSAKPSYILMFCGFLPASLAQKSPFKPSGTAFVYKLQNSKQHVL
jgi:hypothetical protein